MSKSSDNKFWNRVASLYGGFMKSNNALFMRGAEIIAPYIEPNGSILELACGTGQYTSLLCQRAARWVATDFSPTMVAKTRENCHFSSLEFGVEDATQLSYPSESFDVVLIANALHIMPDADAALREILRVLKPSGTIIAPTFTYDKAPPRFRMALLSSLGFKTYNRWQSEELSSYISMRGFKVTHCTMLPSKPLYQAIVIAKKPPLD